MDLRTKFAIMLVMITLVLSLATYGGLEAYKRQEIRRTEADVNETARLAAGQLEARLDEHSDYVAFIAQRAEAEPGDGKLLGEMLDNSRFFAARVVTANGTVVALRGPYPTDRRRELLGANASGDSCVRRTLSTGDICITPPNRAEPNRTYRIGITAPIFEHNRTVGVLEAAIRLNDATTFGPLEPLNRDRQTVRVVHENAILFRGRGSVDRAIVATATVESVGWTVRIRRSRAALNSQLRRIAITQGIGIFLLAAAAVLVGYWEYTVNLRQTDRLLDAFRALERGEYERSLSLSAAREWEQISDGFNRLAATLESREDALREREQRLEVLNRLIRHNLRNEMNVILGHARELRQGNESTDTGESATAIADAADRLLTVGEKARRTTDGFDPEDTPREIDVVPLVRQGVEPVRSEFPDVEIELSLPASMPVIGHSGLRDAVRELVENACEHNDAAAPHVTVEAETAEGTAVIRVTDNGSGLPRVERRTMERGRETSIRHGSGVGLWLVNWIVDRSDGTLAFVDGAPRTTVEIRLRTPDATTGSDDGG